MTAPVNPTCTWDVKRQNRIAKGMCFRCNEKFTTGHWCRQSNFSLMAAAGEEGKAEEAAADSGESDNNPTDLAEISLHAILGKASGTTMKLLGTINGNHVLILVDSGSTHNFTSVLVEELTLPTHPIPPFCVQIGNRDVIRCNMICREVRIDLPNLSVIQVCYPFSIGGADVVLGIKWLASLNTMKANWNEMFMIFYIDGKRYKLQGVHQPTTGSCYLADPPPRPRS